VLGNRVDQGIAFQEDETYFSYAVRYCRLNLLDLSAVIGTAPNLYAFRDFALKADKFSLLAAVSKDFLALAVERSATLFYHSSEPGSSCLASQFARSSLGHMSSHLRWCVDCAKEERKERGFSYWHRNHQLPFTASCDRHPSVVLSCTRIDALGQALLPHEVAGQAPRVMEANELCIKSLERQQARLDSGDGTSRLQEIWTEVAEYIGCGKCDWYDVLQSQMVLSCRAFADCQSIPVLKGISLEALAFACRTAASRRYKLLDPVLVLLTYQGMLT
jgi:hypothetical protein